MEYRVRVDSGVVDDLAIEWLAENCSDTYQIKAQEVWHPGLPERSAMFSHTALIVCFANENDASSFKLTWL